MPRIALVLLALVTSFGVPTACRAQDIARMDQIVQSYVSNRTFAGSVLVARGSDVIVSKGYGLANVEWNVPSSPSARFKVASITKQFTAAAILLLEERGRLKIDDLVKTHLPEAPADMGPHHALSPADAHRRIPGPACAGHCWSGTGRKRRRHGRGIRQRADAAATRVAAGRALQLHERGLLRPRAPYSEAHRAVLRDVHQREHLHAPGHERLGARQPHSGSAPRRVVHRDTQGPCQRLLGLRSRRSEHGGWLVLDDRRSTPVAERFVRRQGDLEGLAAEDDNAVQGGLRARC